MALRYAFMLAAATAGPMMVHAQVEVLVSHAFPGVCQGSIMIAEADSVHWSTGATGWILNAAPGTYSYTYYEDGEATTGQREIGSNGWDVQLIPMATFSGLQISGQVSVEHCGTSNFNTPCCVPDAATTELRILQDGIPFTVPDCLGCSEVQCSFGQFQIQGLPYGHAYQLVVVDPTCAGEVITPAGMVIAHGCANLEVITEVDAATTGQADGTITLVQAVPDPSENYPISAPVVGTAMLRNATTMEEVATFEHVGTAVWGNLEAGEYLLIFSPDEGCQQYSTTVQVGSGTTGVSEASSAGLKLFPTLTEGDLQLAAPGEGPVVVRITDAQGREVLRSRQVAGTVDVASLSAGTYVATLQQGDTSLHTRFIKR